VFRLITSSTRVTDYTALGYRKVGGALKNRRKEASLEDDGRIGKFAASGSLMATIRLRVSLLPLAPLSLARSQVQSLSTAERAGPPKYLCHGEAGRALVGCRGHLSISVYWLGDLRNFGPRRSIRDFLNRLDVTPLAEEVCPRGTSTSRKDLGKVPFCRQRLERPPNFIILHRNSELSTFDDRK